MSKNTHHRRVIQERVDWLTDFIAKRVANNQTVAREQGEKAALQWLLDERYRDEGVLAKQLLTDLHAVIRPQAVWKELPEDLRVRLTDFFQGNNPDYRMKRVDFRVSLPEDKEKR
jgi:hypothetical protein